jgi:hypothetical protein
VSSRRAETWTNPACSHPPFPTAPDQLEDLRWCFQAISEDRERQRALDPSIAVPVDEHEVEQIARWLDEIARDPGRLVGGLPR